MPRVAHQTATAQLGEDIVTIASGMAMHDQPAIAVAQRQGAATAMMDGTARAPPCARPNRGTERHGDLSRGHRLPPGFRRFRRCLMTAPGTDPPFEAGSASGCPIVGAARNYAS
jgi:hypothetical protein